jgi:hypothetical protein
VPRDGAPPEVLDVTAAMHDAPAPRAPARSNRIPGLEVLGDPFAEIEV